MRVSFAPLDKDAAYLLSLESDVDFRNVNFASPKWFCATAYDDEGAIMGLVACEFKKTFDAYFNAVVINRRCMTRRVLRAIFAAVFSKAARITAEVSVDNRAALATVQRLGFVYEGYKRLGLDGHHDIYSYGMLKGDCRFLPDYSGGTTHTMRYPHGQHVPTGNA